jgi:hypothetical protein
VSSPAALTDRARRRHAKQTRFAIGMKVVRYAFARAAGIAKGRTDPASRRKVV